MRVGQGIHSATGRLIVLLAVMVVVLASSAVALAKGPESVTIIGPGIDEPIELMDSVDWPVSCEETCPPDPMVRLMEQTGLWYPTGDTPIAVDQPTGDLVPGYTLTWIRGGFSEEPVVERTFHQFLYLDAEGGPFVHTPVQAGLQDWGGDTFGWYKASEGLPDTLSEMGTPLPGSALAAPSSEATTTPFGLLAVLAAFAITIMVLLICRRLASEM